MIIGICGKMHSGKSTFARYLRNELPNSQIVSLATPIKELAHSITSPRNGNDANDKEKIRPLYQAIGETMKQLYGQNYWLNIFEHNYARYFDDNKNHIIIDDIRFPFEAKFIQNRQGYVAKIERDTDINDNSNHVSELMVSKVVANCVIRNRGTMDALRESAVYLAKKCHGNTNAA